MVVGQEGWGSILQPRYYASVSLGIMMHSHAICTVSFCINVKCLLLCILTQWVIPLFINTLFQPNILKVRLRWFGANFLKL